MYISKVSGFVVLLCFKLCSNNKLSITRDESNYTKYNSGGNDGESNIKPEDDQRQFKPSPIDYFLDTTQKTHIANDKVLVPELKNVQQYYETYSKEHFSEKNEPVLEVYKLIRTEIHDIPSKIDQGISFKYPQSTSDNNIFHSNETKKLVIPKSETNSYSIVIQETRPPNIQNDKNTTESVKARDFFQNNHDCFGNKCDNGIKEIIRCLTNKTNEDYISKPYTSKVLEVFLICSYLINNDTDYMLPQNTRRTRAIEGKPFVYEPYKIIKDHQLQLSKKTTVTKKYSNKDRAKYDINTSTVAQHNQIRGKTRSKIWLKNPKSVPESKISVPVKGRKFHIPTVKNTINIEETTTQSFEQGLKTAAVDLAVSINNIGESSTVKQEAIESNKKQDQELQISQSDLTISNNNNVASSAVKEKLNESIKLVEDITSTVTSTQQQNNQINVENGSATSITTSESNLKQDNVKQGTTASAENSKQTLDGEAKIKKEENNSKLSSNKEKGDDAEPIIINADTTSVVNNKDDKDSKNTTISLTKEVHEDDEDIHMTPNTTSELTKVVHEDDEDITSTPILLNITSVSDKKVEEDDEDITPKPNITSVTIKKNTEDDEDITPKPNTTLSVQDKKVEEDDEDITVKPTTLPVANKIEEDDEDIKPQKVTNTTNSQDDKSEDKMTPKDSDMKPKKKEKKRKRKPAKQKHDQEEDDDNDDDDGPEDEKDVDGSGDNDDDDDDDPTNG